MGKVIGLVVLAAASVVTIGISLKALSLVKAVRAKAEDEYVDSLRSAA